MSTSFREHDIRPADIDREAQRCYENDVARLLKRRGEFVEVACPACAGTESKERFTKYELSFKECSSCATVFLSPRPTPAVLKDFYETSENYAFQNKVLFPASEAARRDRIFRPRVDRLLELCRAHGVVTKTLVEIGAGFGTFCEELTARKVFERVIAVEPTPELAETCRKRGLEVIESRIEDAKLDVRADVVASFEVIEHLFQPRDFIETCRSLLRPGGIVMLTCPNINGFDVDILGAGSPAVDTEHMNYFHPASLGKLLESCGFEVLESLTPGRLDADIVRNRVLAGEFKLEDRFLKRILIDDWERLGEPFQNFIASSGLSSNMWIVARTPAAS